MTHPDNGAEPGRSEHFPLSTLLSQVLVALTIETDNEFEHQMPHRTKIAGIISDQGSGQNFDQKFDRKYSPWLGSLAMWLNCMQFIDGKVLTVGQLERVARTKTNLAGMERWGYVVVEPAPTDHRAKPPHSQWLVRATPAGRQAQGVWRPLMGNIEDRWRGRFGNEIIDQLYTALWLMVSQLDMNLPDCLPILGYGLFSIKRHADDDLDSETVTDRQRVVGESEGREETKLPLVVLLSRLLLAFAIEFERHSGLSLAISANVLRVLDAQGVRLRDLPQLTGVSKEAISMALGILQKRRFALVEPDPDGSRWKIVRLLPGGQQAQETYHRLLGDIETHWQQRFGQGAIHALREPLERLVGAAAAPSSPLFQGLTHYPDGWRALVRQPDTLPHFPMVLHRGGYPDGA